MGKPKEICQFEKWFLLTITTDDGEAIVGHSGANAHPKNVQGVDILHGGMRIGLNVRPEADETMEVGLLDWWTGLKKKVIKKQKSVNHCLLHGC